MKFTLSWLKDHLDTTATVDEITYALTDLGLEVEGVENPADRLKAFTLAKVKHAEQHPDADRLRVCMVETDEGDKQIVCGAPNARAGITVVLAKPGDYVPGIDVTLSVGNIRGVESHGMMASERELELSDEHDGIIELPSGEVGQKFIDWLAENDPSKVDPVIEIAITPNRPDALGVRGIALDLAARGLGQMKPAPEARIEGQFPCPITVSIDDDTREHGCDLFAGRVIRGVKNGPSPQWLQDRLRAIGLRPISALVDITNFFTYDRNRPLHVFDADKMVGDLRVHRTEGGETLTGLDEKEYGFGPGQVVISDAAGIQSIGGIMGGLATGCTEETENVLLEAAVWDHIQIATTGRALKINSDARYRNERGIDVLGYQYDLSCNGYEILSGAIRNHKPDIMFRAFELAGYGETEVRKRFGGMVGAFQYGAPPHGGCAAGIDRIVMLLAGTSNIREVIMFPMNQRAEDLMMNAPSDPTSDQLMELGLRVIPQA